MCVDALINVVWRDADRGCRNNPLLWNLELYLTGSMAWESLNQPTAEASDAAGTESVGSPADQESEPKPKMSEEEREELFKEERESHEKLEKELAVCWTKRVDTPGQEGGRQVKAGARVVVHVVGWLHKERGHVFESTRERGVPMIVIAQRGALVPGLDLALLSCRTGERAVITVAPVGGYGNRGCVDANGLRTVPGSCTLVFEVEVLSVEEEEEV